jgi:hypothetical protein
MQVSGAGGAAWSAGTGALRGATDAPSLATMLINQTLRGLAQAGGGAPASLAGPVGVGGKGMRIDVMA